MSLSQIQTEEELSVAQLIERARDRRKSFRGVQQKVKVTMVLELLEDGELSDHIAAVEYMDFKRSESLSGVFRVKDIEVS